MFFPNTVNAAEKTIIRRSPNKALRQQGTLPGPQLLWICDRIRDLHCDDPVSEVAAKALVEQVIQGMVRQGWWDSLIGDVLKDIDKSHGFDKVHPHQCLAIDQRNVIYIEDERRFTSAAVHIIGQLVQERFGREVYVMIRSKPASPQGHRDFLEKKNFFKETGVKPNNVICYESRAETAHYCRTLGVTHYVSKRIEVLNHAEGAHTLFALDPDPAEGIMPTEGRGVINVASWRQIRALLLEPKTMIRN